MHRIYTSLALIVESRAYAEADRMVACYTREFGLISAVAKSVRLEKSKLRYSLGLYSLAEVSLVKGREVWRLTSAIHEKSFTRHPSSTKKVFNILKRLLGEEIPDPILFDSLKNYLEYLQSGNNDDKAAEVGIMLQILNRLGYIEAAPAFIDFLSEPFNTEKLSAVTNNIKEAVELINQALRHAHL